MTLLLLHGDWLTIVLSLVVALVFWNWPFLVLGLLIAWIVRRRKRSPE